MLTVFEILLKVSEGKPWKDTLLEVLPQRKFRMGGRKERRLNNARQMDSEDGNSSANDDDDEGNENGNTKEVVTETSSTPAETTNSEP